MTITAFPLQAEGKLFGQEPIYRMLNHLFRPGVASGLGVIQNPAGADLSVTVEPGDAYVAMTGSGAGGKRMFINSANSNSGIPGQLNTTEWLATFTAAHATLPRIDMIVAEVQDSLVDGGSGQYRGMLRVVAGTATAGADLYNLTGAPAVPANCVFVRHVLVPAGATTIVTANIGRPAAPALLGAVVKSSTSRLPYHGKPYVYSGGTVSAPGGLAAAVAAGVAMINGDSFDFVASGNLTLTANATNRLWLKQLLDGLGYHSGYTWEVRTDTTVPGNSVFVGEAITNASAVTSFNTGYRGIIQPGTLFARTSLSGSTSPGAGDKMNLQFVGDGVTPIRVEAFAPALQVDTAGAEVFLSIRDAASGGGSELVRWRYLAYNVSAYGSARPATDQLAAFVGAKTYYANMANSAGTATFHYSTGVAWMSIRADY